MALKISHRVTRILVRYAFPSGSHAAARRSRGDSRIARDRFPQNRRRSRPYRASFFLYGCAR